MYYNVIPQENVGVELFVGEFFKIRKGTKKGYNFMFSRERFLAICIQFNKYVIHIY